MKKVIILSVALIFALVAESKIVMPQMFQSGMVLQRGKDMPVWGMADSGEQVVVEFKKKTYKTTAGADGRWQIVLPKQKAGGPYEIKVNDIVIKDVLIGDVWLCSGQSNIDVTIERVYPQYTKDIDNYSNNDIRLFRVQTDTDTHCPKTDVKPTRWVTANKQNAWLFSAVGYFLGREMYEKTGVPQGIIVNSLGGTPIQAWLSADTMKQHYPLDYRRTQFYQDDNMVRTIQRGNQLASNRWQKVMDETDPGFAEGYNTLAYDDSNWNKKYQYDNITGERSYTGSFWARQTVKVDAAHAGQKARLLVGTLFDADFTYINGKEVGRTYYQYPPRRYTIPEGLLKEGDNALTVRFITKGGNPHFIKDKPYKIIFDDGVEIPLSTEWRVKEGARMLQCPQTNFNLQNLPSVLYNAMLCPLAPYGMSGVVWYQGESNIGDGYGYQQLLTYLVNGWRQLWKQPEMPFVIVQLANFMEASDKPQDSGWSHVREAQRLAAKNLPNAELTVAIDLGEAVDIHPLRKWEVAQRVTKCFDKMLWNKKVQLSPDVISAALVEGDIVLTIDQPLRSVTELYEFEVASADGRYVNAKAHVDGDKITIKSPVANPAKVRYAWKNNPARVNAYSEQGLPMVPFQIDIAK